MDWIPILSQLRSAVQAIFRDADGARETQMNFLRQCPGVSQVYAVGACLTGNNEEAKRSQMEGFSILAGVVDLVPVVGHVKGIVHYLVGDKEGGDNSMKSASRTAAQIGAGVGGFMVGGPVGATGAWIASGYAMDGITTGIDSAVHHEYRPSGILSAVDAVYKDPKNPGKWFDVVAPVILDLSTAAFAIKAQPKWKLQQNIGKTGAKIAVELSDTMKNIHKSGKIPPNTVHLMSAAIDTSTGEYKIGHNSRVRKLLNEPLTNKHYYGRSSCAEVQAIERAEAAGLKPDKVVTIKKVPGGTVPAYTCDSCEIVTKAKKLKVPTDYNRGEKTTKPTIPSKIGTRIGRGGAATASAIGRTSNVWGDFTDTHDVDTDTETDNDGHSEWATVKIPNTFPKKDSHKILKLGPSSRQTLCDPDGGQTLFDTQLYQNVAHSPAVMTNLDLNLNFDMKSDRPDIGLGFECEKYDLGLRRRTSDLLPGSSDLAHAISNFDLDLAGKGAPFGIKCRKSASFAVRSNLGLECGMNPGRPNLGLDHGFTTSGFDSCLDTSGADLDTKSGSHEIPKLGPSSRQTICYLDGRQASFDTQLCPNVTHSSTVMSNLDLNLGMKPKRPDLDHGIEFDTSGLSTSGLGHVTSDFDLSLARGGTSFGTECCQKSASPAVRSNLDIKFGMNPKKPNLGLDCGFKTSGSNKCIGTSDFHLGSAHGTSFGGGRASFDTPWYHNSVQSASERLSFSIDHGFKTSGFENRLGTSSFGLSTSDVHPGYCAGGGVSLGTQLCPSSGSSYAKFWI